MEVPSVEHRQQLLHDALELLKSALDLLDRGSAPGHIGAQVDHAIHQLQSILSIARGEITRTKPDVGLH